MPKGIVFFCMEMNHFHMKDAAHGPNKKVYLVWFVRERDEAENIEILVGIYESEADATAAIERVREKPGFVDFPKGFEIDSYELGRDNWVDGFVQEPSRL